MATQKKILPKTWVGFCKMTSRDPKALPDVSVYEVRDQKNAIANFKLTLIIRHCNGSEPDYNNVNQRKYEPRFWIKADAKKSSGFGLSYHDYGYWNTVTGVGPRFAFLSYEDMRHVVKYFLQEYEDLILL